MAHISIPKHKIQSLTFGKFKFPLVKLLPFAPELQSQGTAL